ncbi:MAG: VWA domain-containing protein [Chitinophagales bacterium]
MKYLMIIAITLMAFTSPEKTINSENKIQIALLLDTSNSMDGLIEQAKGKLWSIVNEFGRYEKDKNVPDLEIALFEYGNDGLKAGDDWIRQITAFTTDLDFISEKLFELRTYGGSEYCGAVIHDANKSLEWSNRKDDLRLIFIAGNEGFNQGGFNYKDACQEAKGKDITVNTIFCGDYEQGIRELWKEGALITNGKYINIDQDRSVSYIETPYDKDIDRLNDQLNDTYIWYGRGGADKKINQSRQDANASSFSPANKAERAVSKSSDNYKNAHWDAVDAIDEGNVELDELVKEEYIAPELKNKSKEEIAIYLKEKKSERENIQKEITALNKKRMAYISNQSKDNENTLESAITLAVKELATAKGFRLKVQ